eukprot:gene27429-4729_t
MLTRRPFRQHTNTLPVPLSAYSSLLLTPAVTRDRRFPWTYSQISHNLPAPHDELFINAQDSHYRPSWLCRSAERKDLPLFIRRPQGSVRMDSGIRLPARQFVFAFAGEKDEGVEWDKEDQWRGEKDEGVEWDKEEQWRIQKELKEKRKTGELIQTAKDRRLKVKETVAEKKAVRQNERDQLAVGIMPETLKNWKNYKKKIDEEGTQGLIIPVLPFGLKEFDEGERFDLRSPYSDDGWIEEDELDMWQGFKKFKLKFLNFGGREAVEAENKKYMGKPIQWASTFGKAPKTPKTPPKE